MPSISVLTLVKGRKNALLQFIRGLINSEIPPAELVIVHMNESAYAEDFPVTSFPIRCVELRSEETLPLAKARNYAFSLAQHDHCVLVDVDCIVSPSLLGMYADAFEKEDSVLYAGKVRYLTQANTEKPDVLEHLESYSQADPIRSRFDQFPYELFWSLNFGCSRKVFHTIGGFDESFTGYGAEDTDFSFTARHRGIELITLPVTAYHQYHPSYSPPLNHLESIVSNARQFYQKWKLWPMEGWLAAFQKRGYITWSEDQISVEKLPSITEIQETLKS
ncbi:glycosyltransferase [Siphonobacter sp. SORGH_AS_0500]|uniref:glycosyltransferase family 2 protein n=1 Tax=Siphonobacter sp. SORGH_AS_0500 TaxID=1864824 RepID=UPI0028676785|nr:glycosyltransferase [Siphonobacter sp. SORGH_AS_0500]MDR6197570.1 GT2 family glycosyltransferase [Siphonobacter sp. SORGH_AS_0500]